MTRTALDNQRTAGHNGSGVVARRQAMSEADIRPAELFNRYLELARRDVELHFRDMSRFFTAPCPGCGETRFEHAFTKHGFSYATCPACDSLYLNPRPERELIDAYYRNAASVRFWSSTFYPTTAAKRLELMFRPRAEAVCALASTNGADGSLVDVGPGYGLFLEAVRDLGAFGRIAAVEPNAELRERCESLGVETLGCPVEDVHRADAGGVFRGAFDCATNFEVLEHVYDPSAFLLAIGRLLRPGGLLVLTTLTSSGFDIAELLDRSKSVHPPHHINLLTLTGLRVLFERSGYEVVELTTPGELDVSILRGAIEEGGAAGVSRFARSIAGADEATRGAFQRFLRDHALSSHVRVAARWRCHGTEAP
jgi:SAM-dependent methyltransferase